MRETTIRTNSAQETKRFGKWLCQFLRTRDVVGLAGQLGSGKTILVQGIGEGLNVSDKVRSPSFTIVNEYSGVTRLYHIDLYRLTPEEFFRMGLDEYLNGDGIAVIEWADKIRDYLGQEGIYIELRRVAAKVRELTVRTERDINVGSWS